MMLLSGAGIAPWQRSPSAAGSETRGPSEEASRSPTGVPPRASGTATARA